MAISLPTARLALDETRYSRGRYILSGDAAGDLTYGMRGLVNQANHAYAYRVQTVASAISYNDDNVLEQTTTTSWVDAYGPAYIEWGADVVTIAAKVDFQTDTATDSVSVRLAAHDGTAWRYSSATADTTGSYVTATEAATLTVTTGAVGRVKLQVTGDADNADIEIRNFVIYETVLTSGQIP